MKIVVFGLAVSSSWGNGHATLWRGLARALSRRGHQVIFFERDQPFYAQHRDATEFPGMDLVLYDEWASVRGRAFTEVAGSDLAMVTSYCPDGRAASDLVLEAAPAIRCFYDLDTPVTLERLDRGEDIPYIPRYGLGGFDLVLSYTGGRSLEALRQRFGARRTAPLYGSVDPEVHRPTPARAALGSDLSYLGTYAPDRQAALDELCLAAAERLPHRRFLIGGAQYPREIVFPPNVRVVSHVAPADHAAFYASSPLTLNVTRAAMAAIGHCPSARFFEAAACGVPVLSDAWDGIERFFTPGRELLLARSRQDTIDALSLSRAELAAIGARARERTLDEHTADCRAAELEGILEESQPKGTLREAV